LSPVRVNFCLCGENFPAGVFGGRCKIRGVRSGLEIRRRRCGNPARRARRGFRGFTFVSRWYFASRR
jgi:hypothetical protein